MSAAVAPGFGVLASNLKSCKAPTGLSQSSQSNDGRHEAQHRLIVSGQSLISGRYPAELASISKKAFHQIALLVEMPIQRTRVCK